MCGTGWLTLPAGPAEGRLRRLRRFLREFPPAQAPPDLAWISVEGSRREQSTTQARALGQLVGLKSFLRLPAGRACMWQDRSWQRDREPGGRRLLQLLGCPLCRHEVKRAVRVLHALAPSPLQDRDGALADWAAEQQQGSPSAEAALQVRRPARQQRQRLAVYHRNAWPLPQIGRRRGILTGKWMVHTGGPQGEGAIWGAVARWVHVEVRCWLRCAAQGCSQVWRCGRRAAPRTVVQAAGTSTANLSALPDPLTRGDPHPPSRACASRPRSARGLCRGGGRPG
jgi:hypothetical protein